MCAGEFHCDLMLDRRTVMWAMGGAIFAAPTGCRANSGFRSEMILASEDSSFRLRIEGYQFPDMSEDEHDANWLIVEGEVEIAGRNWSFRDPCLMTTEAQRLADWLDACAKGLAQVPYCDFLEPNLQFNLLDESTVRVSFALEAAPPWAERGDDWTKHGFNLPTGPSLTAAAAKLREQLSAFPVRGSGAG